MGTLCLHDRADAIALVGLLAPRVFLSLAAMISARPSATLVRAASDGRFLAEPHCWMVIFVASMNSATTASRPSRDLATQTLRAVSEPRFHTPSHFIWCARRERAHSYRQSRKHNLELTMTEAMLLEYSRATSH